MNTTDPQPTADAIALADARLECWFAFVSDADTTTQARKDRRIAAEAMFPGKDFQHFSVADWNKLKESIVRPAMGDLDEAMHIKRKDAHEHD